jgi:hypothetical protein
MNKNLLQTVSFYYSSRIAQSHYVLHAEVLRTLQHIKQLLHKCTGVFDSDLSGTTVKSLIFSR